MTWDLVQTLREYEWVAIWGAFAIAATAGALDVYFLLLRLYRRLYPLIRELAPEDLAYLGRDMADRAREIRKAAEAERAAKARIEARRREVERART